MSFSVGIVGLPNVGKSTLFKTLTKNKVDIAPYPFTTVHPNYGVVRVPDERLDKIAEIIKPEKVTPTIIEFVDIAGLVKGAHKGEGLGNQFLAQIRNCDAIAEVIRAFGEEIVENVLGEVSPGKEMEIVKTELLMKDLEILEGLIQKSESDSKKDKKSLKKFELFKKIKEGVSQGKSVSEINLTDEEKAEIKEYQFLTGKPILYILNTDGRHPPATQLKYSTSRAVAKGEEENLFSLPSRAVAKREEENIFSLPSGVDYLEMNLKDEEEISELSEKDKKELEVQSQLDRLILNCYNILDLITFFTVAGLKECRAWTLKKGLLAPEAGGKVHSDFKEKFIRSDVIPWESLVKSGCWKTAKESGLIKTVGKEYVVQDGDVIEFKI